VHRAFREIGWSGMMVIDNKGENIGIRDKWRALTAALIEDEDVGRMVSFHQSTL
jgi:translation initiation factor IF-3